MKSIKMSKLGCKIISGLAASIIGLSPCLGTQVFAAPVFIPSIKQSKEIEDCTKEELQEVVHGSWERFWIAMPDAMDDAGAAPYQAARDAARDAAWDAARDAARDAAGDAAFNTAYNVARKAAWTAAYNVACAAMAGFYHAPSDNWSGSYANAWGPNGAAYEIVKDNDRGYFENLVRVLEEQIAILEDIANRNQH